MVRNAGTRSPATTAAVAGSMNTQKRAPSCHRFGSNDDNQYRPTEQGTERSECDQHRDRVHE